jgi:CysZ protein
MFDAAIKALTQMFSPPFRRVLLKSIGLALLLVLLIGIGLNRVFSWMAESGATWAEATAGGHTVWQVIAWMLSFVATLGIITGAVFLMPAVSAFVGSFFVDEIGEEVEREYYPHDRRGTALSLFEALTEGLATAILAIMVYLCAVPLLFVAGLGLVIMFLANAYLLSREYFLLAAMRFRPPDEARAMRRAHRTQIFLAGLLIALFVSIPIVSLATPLFAMAMMVHMHKRLSQGRLAYAEARRA